MARSSHAARDRSAKEFTLPGVTEATDHSTDMSPNCNLSPSLTCRTSQNCASEPLESGGAAPYQGSPPCRSCPDTSRIHHRLSHQETALRTRCCRQSGQRACDRRLMSFDCGIAGEWTRRGGAHVVRGQQVLANGDTCGFSSCLDLFD